MVKAIIWLNIFSHSSACRCFFWGRGGGNVLVGVRLDVIEIFMFIGVVIRCDLYIWPGCADVDALIPATATMEPSHVVESLITMLHAEITKARDTSTPACHASQTTHQQS